MNEKEKAELVRASQTAGAHPLADAFHEAVMAELDRMNEVESPKIEKRNTVD